MFLQTTRGWQRLTGALTLCFGILLYLPSERKPCGPPRLPVMPSQYIIPSIIWPISLNDMSEKIAFDQSLQAPNMERSCVTTTRVLWWYIVFPCIARYLLACISTWRCFFQNRKWCRKLPSPLQNTGCVFNLLNTFLAYHLENHG